MNIIKEKCIPIYEYLRTNIFSKKININYSSEKINVYMFLSADYGNLGDVAICHAQKSFLEKFYSDYNIIEVPLSNTFDYIKSLKKNIKNSDLIALVGGGNFGNNYAIIDFMRLFIIKCFKNNKIISFPQTIDFDDSKYGQRRLAENIRVLNNHKDIVLFAREQISYDLMCKYFPNKEIYLCPDIVLSLDMDKDFNRDGVLFAFRNDNEKNISDEFIVSLKTIFDKKNMKVTFKDTTISNDNFICDEKMNYLNDILVSFSNAKLVITDRLHGMIFSYITSTPCIVLPNSNHKIISTYNTWLCDCNYIRFISDLNNIDNVIDELLSFKNISKIDFKDNYNELKNCFK